jgi:hypothetical protein
MHVLTGSHVAFDIRENPTPSTLAFRGRLMPNQRYSIGYWQLAMRRGHDSAHFAAADGNIRSPPGWNLTRSLE